MKLKKKKKNEKERNDSDQTSASRFYKWVTKKPRNNCKAATESKPKTKPVETQVKLFCLSPFLVCREYIIGGVDNRILKTGVLGMEKVMNILKPKPNPQQQLRDWQRKLRQECRNIERQIRG